MAGRGGCRGVGREPVDGPGEAGGAMTNRATGLVDERVIASDAGTDAAAATPVTRIVPVRDFFEFDVRELWSYRELLFFLAWRDVRVRYKQAVIGAGWAVIQPLLTMVVFTVVFGRMAGLAPAGLPAPIFYYSALVPWLYFAGAVTQATASIVGNQALVKKVYFPRLILPVAGVASGLVDFTLAFTVLLGMVVYYGLGLSWSLLVVPLLLGLTLLLALGLGLWLSSLNAVYRDVRHAVPFLIQVWMFASPVVYPASLVPERWRWLYRLNPMTSLIEGFRWAVTGYGQPPGVSLLATTAGVLGLLLLGIVYFKRTEAVLADVV
jgi:homopolymeric O-antigen transport system permease protein